MCWQLNRLSIDQQLEFAVGENTAIPQFLHKYIRPINELL
jgi:hypothetical protein